MLKFRVDSCGLFTHTPGMFNLFIDTGGKHNCPHRITPNNMGKLDSTKEQEQQTVCINHEM